MAKRIRLTTPLPILGIDVSQPGEYIASRATKRSLNMVIHRSLIEKRPGTLALGASLSERVQFMTELDNGANTFFVRIGLTKFQELNKTTLAWTSRAHAVLTGAVTDQVSAAFPLLSGARILVYTNGKDPIRKYTGGVNDAALGGSPPLARYLTYYAGYLILLHVTAGGTRFPWRIDWSDTANPENYSTGNAGSMNLLEDSSDITGGGNFGQYFTVHKENCIYVGALTNTSQVFRMERKETGAGTIANRTIVSLPTGEQIFLALDGLRLFNGITAPAIESLVNDELRDTLNSAMAYKSWGKIVRDRDEVWIGVPIGSDTEPSTIYKFNYKTRQVHKDVRGNVTAVGAYRNTVGEVAYDDLPSTYDAWVGPYDSVSLGSLNPIHTFGFSDGASSFQNTGSSDVGLAIAAAWDAREASSTDYGLEHDLLMRWQEIRLWAKGAGVVEVYYTLDGGVTFTLAGSLALSAEFPSDFSPQVLYVDEISTRLGIRLVHQGNAQTFTLKNYALVACAREEAGR